MRLVPVELWDFDMIDFTRGLVAAFGGNARTPLLHLPAIGDCIGLRSARAGIVVAIRALGLPKRARIGVPLYCCPVVFKAIVMAGCLPTFLDVDPDSCCVSAEDLSKKHSDLDCVIAVHMFGNTCDIPSIKQASLGKPIIEDCAQSLGSVFQGIPSGTLGDISVFSFRSGKYLSAGEGGALYTADNSIMSKLIDMANSLPVPRQIQELQHLARTFIRSTLRSKPWYGLLGFHLWATYNRNVDSMNKSPITLGRMFQSDFRTIQSRLHWLRRFISIQRMHADYYSRELNLNLARICPEPPGSYYNRYLFPIIFTSMLHRDQMMRYLHSRGVNTSRPYADVAAVATSYYGYSGDCPVSEQIARQVIAIPSHHNLSVKDIKRIAGHFNDGIAMIMEEPL